MTRVVETEVLVVGGGGAGARAALEAYASGAKVTLAVKGKFGITAVRGSGATGYRGNGRPMHLFSTPKEVTKSKDEPATYRRVPLQPQEEQEVYFERTLQAGLGMANRRLTRVLVDEAPEAKQALEKWGLLLEKSPYLDSLIAPMPGLAYAIKNTTRIDILEETMVTGLLTQEGRCVGAIGVDETSGDPVLLRTKATILATGGNGQLFMLNFHPSCITGDGYALGYEAGAELINMEFGQVFIATAYPGVDAVPYPIWKSHPKVLNVNGEEFIQNYLPPGVTVSDCMDQKLLHGPFSSRDISRFLDIAMVKETKAGRANKNNAFLLELKRLKLGKGDEGSWVRGWLEFRGIDLQKEYLEINVAYHCSNGGLRVDENGQTTVSGLYTVGEAASGPYGADRLGGAMMTSSQVFGARAGRHAAARVKTMKEFPDANHDIVSSHLERIKYLKRCAGSRKPQQFMEILKKLAWENLLVVRTKDGLIQLLEDMEKMRKDMVHQLSVEGTGDLVKSLELTDMLRAGEMIGKVALMRTESRGSHYRDDFPERDDNHWLHSIVVKKVQGEMNFMTTKLDEQWQMAPDDLKGLWWG